MKKTLDRVLNASIATLGLAAVLVGAQVWHRSQREQPQAVHNVKYVGNEPIRLPAEVPREHELLPIFPGYNDNSYRMHDETILASVSKWNAHFKNVKGYVALDPALVKAVCLQESGSRHDLESWLNDPMSLAHEGDIGFEDLIKKDATHLIPGNTELTKLEREPFQHGTWNYGIVPRQPGKMRIDAGLSINEGVHLLCQKGLKFTMQDGKLEASFRGWDEAVKRYNGGGDKQYVKHVMDKYNTVKVR